MNKTELYDLMIKEVTGIKMSKAAMEQLITVIDTNMKPKAGGGSSKNPPLMDDGQIVEAYCRYYQAYFPADEMVISKGKSKGYSKVAIGHWNKAQRLVKKLTEKYMELEDAMGDEAKGIKETIMTLKADSLDPIKYQNGSLVEYLKAVETKIKVPAESEIVKPKRGE